MSLWQWPRIIVFHVGAPRLCGGNDNRYDIAQANLHCLTMKIDDTEAPWMGIDHHYIHLYKAAFSPWRLN
jgi:hypothetical protein